MRFLILCFPFFFFFFQIQFYFSSLIQFRSLLFFSGTFLFSFVSGEFHCESLSLQVRLFQDTERSEDENPCARSPDDHYVLFVTRLKADGLGLGEGGCASRPEVACVCVCSWSW